MVTLFSLARYLNNVAVLDWILLPLRMLRTTGWTIWRHLYTFRSQFIRCVRKISKSDSYLRHVCVSICPSVHASAWYNSAPTGRIFMKFDMWVFFENLSRNFKFRWNVTIITDTLHEYLCAFMISRWILVRMRTVSDKCCRENQNTFCAQNPFPESRVVYEIMWKNMVEPDRPQMAI
jgi:hypothetical protein